MKWGMAGPRGWVAQGVVANQEIGTLVLREWHNLVRPRRALGVNAAGEAQRVRVEAQLARWRVPMKWIVPTAQAAGVVNRYDEPWTLSPARWASLVAARARVLAGGEAPAPCVVVGAGTLITVDALDADGTFRGGVALPGLNAMEKSLGDASAAWRTARGHWREFPTNNADAAATGVLSAATGAIGRLRERLRGGDAPVRCFVTGGAAQELVRRLAPPVDLVDNLVLEGALALADA